MHLTLKAYPKRAFRSVRTATNSALCLAFLILSSVPVHAQRFVKVVNTIDELVRLNPNDVHTNVFVADPARGGLFVLAPRGTTNSGTAFASTNATKQWNREYVTNGPIKARWFGAVPGDGVEDNTKLNAAMNAMNVAVNERQNLTSPAGLLELDFGKYELDAPIKMRGGVILQGMGRDATVLRLRSTTTNALEIVVEDTAEVLHPWHVVRDLGIVGATDATAGTLIKITGSVGPNLELRNVWADQGWRGMELENVVGGVISNCKFTGQNEHGIVTVGTMNDVVFNAVGVNAAAGDGWLVRGNYNHFLSIYGELCGGKGFNAFSAGGVSLSASQVFGGFELNTGQDFYMDNARDSLVNIYTVGSATNGIEILGATGMHVIARVDGVTAGWAFKTGNGTGGSVSYNNKFSSSGLFGTVGTISSQEGWSGMNNDQAHVEWWGTKHLVDASSSPYGLFSGSVRARQSGGVAGMDEVWMYHDGDHGYVQSRSGDVKLDSPGGIIHAMDTMYIGGSGLAPETHGVQDIGGDNIRFRLLWLTRFPVVTNSAVQSLSAGTQITRDAAIARITGSAGPVTSTATPLIATGVTNEFLMLEGTSDANTVTLQDISLISSGLWLQTPTIVLGNKDRLMLQYSEDSGLWEEVYRNDWPTVINAGLATKQDAFTTAVGVTNIANVLSGTYQPGTNVVFVTNSTGVQINTSATLTDTDGYTLLPIVTTTDGTQTHIFTNTVANNSMVVIDAHIDAINSTADEARHVAIHWIGLNTGGTVAANATSFVSETFVAPGSLADDWAVNRIVATPSANQWVITVQNNSPSPTETVKWQMRYKLTTLAP